MKITPLVLALSLGCAGAALAQPDAPAKGNAPLKPAHTVNDGGARNGANSFTEGQARQHILRSGFDSVTGLAKGSDGVWRGTAMKGGVSSQVAMDFKGNVTDAGGAPIHKAAARRTTHAASTAPASSAGMTGTDGAAMGDAGAMGGAGSNSMSTTTTTGDMATTAPVHHHRRHHHGTHAGAAKSGVDKNDNGISDREDRAISNGKQP